MQYNPNYYNAQIAVIYQQKPYIVDGRGLWILAYKQKYPEVESVKVISRKIYYNEEHDRMLNNVLSDWKLQSNLQEIIRLLNDDNKIPYKITFSNEINHLEIFETALKLLNLNFEVVETFDTRTYILTNEDFVENNQNPLVRILVQKEFADKAKEIKIKNLEYFKLTELQRKRTYAFRYPLEIDKIVIYLIYTTTVFEDFIYFVAYQNSVKVQYIINISNLLEKTFSPTVIIKYLTHAAVYEIFGSNVSVYYPSEYHYNDQNLRYFESRVRLITFIPNLEFLNNNRNQGIVWYRTLLSEYIVYLSLTYGDKVYLHHVGFNLKNRNKVKNSLVEQQLALYIDSIFLNRFRKETYLGNESALLSHLKCPNITRYISKF